MKALFIASMLISAASVLAAPQVQLTAEENRLHFIQSIGEVAPAVDIEAYERELNYINQGLSLEEKVQREANKLIETIRLQVIKAYESELQSSGNSLEAYELVRAKIDKDLELAEEGMKEDILKVTEHALRSLNEAPRSEEFELTNLKNILREEIKNREAYLLGLDITTQAHNKTVKSPTGTTFHNYASKADIIKSLISNEDSARWFRTANATLKSAVATSRGTDISLQVKIEFLGVGLSAGPRISFRRDYSTSVTVLGEGLTPVLDNQGRFNHYELDSLGRKTKTRRFIGFFCDATLSFKTEYNGEGSFSVVGMGAGASASKEYANQVALNSRRIYVPEYIGNKAVDLNTLTQICHNDFLNAQINSKVKVKDSLDLMMKNVISGIRFSHPETKCLLDSHCTKWFNTEVLSILRNKAKPRCLGNVSEGKFSCVLRGTQGQSCTVIENGKRTSSGLGEYICDKGLRCIKTRNAGWLQGGRLYQPSFGVCK